MRKKYLLGMTLMASLAFSSCTKEVFVVQDGEGVEEIQEDGQVLTLQVSNSGDGLTTRAGRPLLSSQAKQDINHIDLFVVNSSNKVVLKKTVKPSEWANALDYTTGGHGKQLQISFKGSEGQKLAAGSYTIYAVGYKVSSNYKTEFGVTGEAPTTTSKSPTVTFTETNFATTLTANGTSADEIFAGKVEVKVVGADSDSYITTSTGSTKKDKPTLVLNRQVAGVTGYFTNIPAKVGEQIPAKIRLIASNKSNKVHFTSLFVEETDNTTTAATNVVNGSASSLTAENLAYWNSSNKGYKVYEIALSEFFPQLKEKKPETEPERNYNFADLDLDNDGFVGYKDAQAWVYRGQNVTIDERDWSKDIKGGVVINSGSGEDDTNKTRSLSDFWKNKEAYKGKQTLVAGSVFAGEFIIPFLQVTSPSNVNTFELQLLDENGKILKNWNVQVPTGQKVTSPTLADGISSAGMPTITNDVSTLVYNIYRNHLYSLGLKTNDIEGGGEPGTTDPDPKPEPDPDTDPDPEDKPEDLSKGQDLLINVNDNWEVIHKMEID